MANNKKVREVMTPSPFSLPSTSSVHECARAMRDNDVGAVIVLDGDEVCGIVTDRDIVVRSIANDEDPHKTPLSRVCTKSPTTLQPDDSVDEAVTTMRQQAIRRLPVMQNGKLVGIVSIGDLAISQQPESALGAISSAPPNN